jgi:hypothetical protein
MECKNECGPINDTMNVLRISNTGDKYGYSRKIPYLQTRKMQTHVK